MARAQRTATRRAYALTPLVAPVPSGVVQNSSDSPVAPTTRSDLGRALVAYDEARRAATAAARRTLGLNELDAKALIFVAQNPGARPSHVRDHLGITSAGVTTLIDRLVQRGAVRRDLDNEDRRVNHITATVDLECPPWSALRAYDDAVEAAIETMDPAEADAVAAALDRLTAAGTASG
jgi:DNA-binding MarR family transcriptional regulator